MAEMFFVSLWIGLLAVSSNGIRGPHHPKSTVSHHHYKPRSEVKLTQDTELLHDTTHLKEDMGSLADQLDFSKMTEQEIEFHYFKAHDFDNNTKLDGLEILHAIQHTYHEKGLGEDEDYKEDVPDFAWIVGAIDEVLEVDDVNNDGYLEYVEFVMGRQRGRMAQEKRTKFQMGT